MALSQVYIFMPENKQRFIHLSCKKPRGSVTTAISGSPESEPSSQPFVLAFSSCFLLHGCKMAASPPGITSAQKRAKGRGVASLPGRKHRLSQVPAAPRFSLPPPPPGFPGCRCLLVSPWLKLCYMASCVWALATLNKFQFCQQQTKEVEFISANSCWVCLTKVSGKRWRGMKCLRTWRSLITWVGNVSGHVFS